MVLSIFQPFFTGECINSLSFSFWGHSLGGGDPERGASLEDQLSVCNEPWCKITERNIIIYAGLSEEHVASGWAPAVIASCSAPGTIPVLCLQNLPCSGPATSLISHLISIHSLIVGGNKANCLHGPDVSSFFLWFSLFVLYVCILWTLVLTISWVCEMTVYKNSLCPLQRMYLLSLQRCCVYLIDNGNVKTACY